MYAHSSCTCMYIDLIVSVNHRFYFLANDKCIKKKKKGITGLIVSGAADVKSNHYFLTPPTPPPEGVSAEPSVPDADRIVPVSYC